MGKLHAYPACHPPQEIDFRWYETSRDGQRVEMTRNEFAILR
jgi:hypothetical protein